MDLVSIIIPVYNVERYLKECFDSLLLQSYTNFEAIIIDDGSTDGSGTICDEYAKKDERFKVVHKKNGGAGSARNIGLNLAKGKYIGFIDSDDYVNVNYLKIMVENSKSYDIIQCNELMVFTNRIVPMHAISSGAYDNISFLEKYIINWNCSLLHNKLFKKECIKDIFFEEGHIVDDEYFTYQCVLKSKNVLQIDECLYNYRMRKSGVMHSVDSMKRIYLDRIDYLFKRFNKVKHVKELRTLYLSHMVNQYLFFLQGPSLDNSIVCGIKVRLFKVLFQVRELKLLKSIIFVFLKPTKYFLKQQKVEFNDYDIENYFE